LLAGLALLVWSETGAARMHGPMHCWVPDSELPVPCEDEGEGDESERRGHRRSDTGLEAGIGSVQLAP
jgi:hypothetical protein